MLQEALHKRRKIQLLPIDWDDRPANKDAVLLQVDEYMYELTVDSIHEIFKGYGEVRKIAIFQKNNQWQALVQYPDHQVWGQHLQHH